MNCKMATFLVVKIIVICLLKLCMSLILPMEGESSFKIIVSVFCTTGHHFNILDYLFFSYRLKLMVET